MGSSWSRRREGSTDWHDDPDVLAALQTFIPVNNANTAPVVGHLKTILCTLDRELPERNVHLNIGYLGGDHDLSKPPSDVPIFHVMLVFLSITPESELDLLTSSCLDKKRVAQDLFQKLHNAIMDNDRLKTIIRLRCEGSIIWMDVLAQGEDQDLPEYYSVKLVPAFRCTRGRDVELYTPAKQGSNYKRYCAVEEKTSLVDNKGYQNYQKVIFIIKMLFANDRVLAPLKSAVHTSTKVQVKAWKRDWRKDSTLTHCVMDVLKHTREALTMGRLDRHVSGENILKDYTSSEHDRMDGRLERLLFNKTEFMKALEMAKNFRKDRKPRMYSWTLIIAGYMLLTILAATFCQNWISTSMDQVCSPEGHLQRRLPWICSFYQEEPQTAGWTGRHMVRILSSGKHQIEKACTGENLSAEGCLRSLSDVIQKLQAVETINSHIGSGHQNEDACPGCKGEVELWDILNLLLVIYVTFILVVVLVWRVVSEIRRDAVQN